VSTKPVSPGNWVEPTSYAAFDARHVNLEYNYREPPFWDSFFNEWVYVQYTGKLKENSWFGAPMTWGCSNSYPYPPVVPNSVVQRNRARLLGKIRNSNFNLGQAAAEAGETFEMIARKIRTFARAYHSFKVGNYGRAIDALGLSRRKHKKLGPNLWLEMAYGWVPLLSDIYDGCNAMVKGVGDAPKWTVKSTTVDPNFEPPKPYASLQSSTRIKVSGTFRRGISSGATFTVPGSIFFTLDQLGLDNPWAIVWEALPFSFVVDWFFHISEFLAYLTLPLVVDFIHGYETYWLNSAWMAEEFNPKFLGTQPKQVFRTKSMSRVPNNGFVIPTPYCDPLLSRGQVMNAIALIAQYIR